MLTLPLRQNSSVGGIRFSHHVTTDKQWLPFLISCHNICPDDPFDALSAIFPFQNDNTKFWWQTTGSALAQMLNRANYPLHQQYRYLVFYYLAVLPELGPMPLLAPSTSENGCKSVSVDPAEIGLDTLASFGPQFQSYMTDDHSPIEFSWLFDSEGGAVTRFAVDPVRRQLEGDSRGAMGLFEDLGRSNILAKGFDLDWCKVCADSLTLSAPSARDSTKAAPEYPSQYFVGFDFSSLGVVLKAYFLPETRATVTSTSKSTLITSCILALSAPTPNNPSPPDLLTPWKRTLSFFSTLPTYLSPDLNIVAVDCVPAGQNRVKVYARTPRPTLTNIRRFFTLGRDLSCTSSATQRALKQVTVMWHLLFPTLADGGCDDVEPLCPPHPTGGLLWYYELLPGYSEPFPKVYLPVRHWCSSDEQVVQVMEAFYIKTGNFKAAQRYGRDVRNTYTHRPLSARSGIHTYISVAVKPNDVEVTSYFNPECYAPEREGLY